MTNVDVLSNQRQELERCASRRERSLRTLFGVSLAFLGITEGGDGGAYHPEAPERELSAFLDANDISQNRPFDVSTLPSQRLRILEHGRGRTTETRQQKAQQLLNSESSNTQGAKAVLADNEQTNGRSARADLAAPEHASSEAASNGYHASSNLVAPVTSKDTSVEGLRNTSTKLSLEQVQPQNVGKDEEPTLEGNGPSIGANGRTEEQSHNLTPPDSGRTAYVLEEGDSSKPSFKTQAANTRKPSYGTAPTTPNEQLRIGEPPSMQQPDSVDEAISPETIHHNSSSDLPSQFIQDSYGEGNSMMDIASLSDEAILNPPENAEATRVNEQPASGMRNSVIAGMNGGTTQDPTFSRRPPICIDTSLSSTRNGTSTASVKSHTSVVESATPNKTAPVSSSAPSPPERMMTRVSSGALRHKSVSEILGETPKSTPTSADKSTPDGFKEDAAEMSTSKSLSAFTVPDPMAFKLRLGDMKEKDRSKPSTVVFAKPQSSAGLRSLDLDQSQQIAGENRPRAVRDYFLTFFAAQAFTPPRAPPLSALLKTAHKTLATTDHYIEHREKQDFRVLSQIKDLQTMGRWSLRQPERSAEPQRPVTHWDVLLGHMKWMRTDFREERKFKLAGAKFLAEACATWVSGSLRTRSALQVRVRRKQLRSAPVSVSATPDLVNDEISEATEDDFAIEDPTNVDPPAAMFSLPPDVFIFGLNRSPVAEKILLELPCYDPAKDVHDAALGTTSMDPDHQWKKKLIPVSKYAEGKLVSQDQGPPRKKSRLESLDTSTSTLVACQAEESTPLAPLDREVALFNPDNKHIRDRIHAGHAFRPPSEYQMPSRDFFECRSPSQWTMTEDDELRRLVREYSYNWSLISSCLSSASMYSSGAERRTPWECFERWISLEGLPADMSKVDYFRRYHQRLQQAARAYEARQQTLAQQQNGNAPQQSIRRRTNQPYTVEKRRNNKPIHLIDAMRKHAKKNEAAQHKQQQGASLAAMRKAAEVPKERPKVHTPREYSRLKYEKHMKMEEQNRLIRIQLQNSKQAKKAAAQQQAGQQSSAVPPNRSTVPGMPNGNSPNLAPVAGPPRAGGMDAVRPGPQIPRLMNGQMNGVVPTNGQNVPHAPMQPQPQMQMSVGQRVPPMTGDLRLMQEAQRVQAEQQAYLQHQQRQQRLPQANGQAGSPNMQSLNPLPQTSAAMLASMQARSSPSINGAHAPQMSSTSPRIDHSQPQTLSSGMTPAVNQIQTQVKLRHPTASPEEIKRLTTDQLVRMSQQHSQQQFIQQTAMAAAVGNSGGSMGGLQAPNPLLQQQQAVMANGNTGMFNQQQYAQYMRNQQASQQRTASAGNGSAPVMNGSRSGTPLVQRTGSAQGGLAGRGPSQSPRPGSVGLAGTQ